jgi:outer membrane protein assembly factor BamD
MKFPTITLRHHQPLYLLSLIFLAIAGCSTTPADEYASVATEKMYAEAKEQLETGNYESAIKILDRVEGRATGTLLSQQATLDIAFARYKNGERPEALASLDRFIKQHPSSPALDYAYYLKGIVNFNDNLGLLYSSAQQDPAERDPQASKDAYLAFSQLVKQFPQSKYAPDAKIRMDYITNTLARYEVKVAEFYFKREAFLAAANRAQKAVADYQGAPATKDALQLMIKCYDKLGLSDLRDDAQRVLNKNFPPEKQSSTR